MILEALQECCKAVGAKIKEHTVWVLSSPDRVKDLVASAGRGKDRIDRALAENIMLEHVRRMATVTSDTERKSKAKSFLKPLRDRACARTAVGALQVEPAEGGPATFHDWLAAEPKRERLRDIRKCRRILDGIGRWPLGWMEEVGVVCFERALGRIEQERGGEADADFMRGVVKTSVLPTAVASASDHYVVLELGKAPRFMTVEEVGRGFGLPMESPLMGALTATTGVMTAVQAVECLGRSVHVGVAQQLIAKLLANGTLAKGMLYGSAYSGVDTFAAAVEAEMSGDWEYAFASEQNGTVRRGLLRAWSGRGLTADHCHNDAMGEPALSSQHVDLYETTPEVRAVIQTQPLENAKGSSGLARRGLEESRICAATETEAGDRGKCGGAECSGCCNGATEPTRGLHSRDECT
jgi:hypothetical protein